MSKVLEIIVLLLLIGALGFFVTEAVELRFDNRDMMLCNSALQSGNEEYLRKCECFYAGDNIRCIYERKK